MSTKQSQLTAGEMGKLWAAYMGNTMGKCTLSYYLKHVDNKDIKKALEYALGLCESYIQEIKTIFDKANFPTPVGFTEQDVNLQAPRLFHDEFYLHYLIYLSKAGLSLYSVAIPLMTRKDIQDFFNDCLKDTTNLSSIVTGILQSKGILTNSPIIPPPGKIDFVTRQSFLNKFWGDKRPLHGLEIVHLYGCISNDTTSKALIIGFSQGTKDEKVKEYLERGKDINQKHIKVMSEKLTEDDLPSLTLQDHLVTQSTIPPFSNKLMVFHKIDMFVMKIREYANGASLSGRKDIGVMYGKMQMDVTLYFEDGANIMIDRGWMEQPPETVDRDKVYAN